MQCCCYAFNFALINDVGASQCDQIRGNFIALAIFGGLI